MRPSAAASSAGSGAHRDLTARRSPAGRSASSSSSTTSSTSWSSPRPPITSPSTSRARAVADFAVVFGLIWTAWVNGSLYLELHGREDGRTRTHRLHRRWVCSSCWRCSPPTPPGSGGRGFALVYAAVPRHLDVAVEQRPASGSPGPPRVPRRHRALRGAPWAWRGRDVRQRLPRVRPTTRRVGGRRRRLDRRASCWWGASDGRLEPRPAAHGVAGRAVRAVHDHRARRVRVRRRGRPVRCPSATP